MSNDDDDLDEFADDDTFDLGGDDEALDTAELDAELEPAGEEDVLTEKDNTFNLDEEDLEGDDDEFSLSNDDDDDEGEFSLSNDDDAFDYDAELPAASGLNKQKQVVAAVGAVLLLFGLWQVIGMLGGDDDEDALKMESIAKVEPPPMIEPEPKVELPTPPTLAIAPIKPIKPPEPVAPPVQQIIQTVDLAPIESKLSNYAERLDDYNDSVNIRLRRIESGLRNITDDMDDLNRNMGHVGDKIHAVNGIVQQMSDQFHSLGDSADAERQGLARQEKFSNPSLNVHAIIPGRAWLKKRDGGIITITEGDMLGEYGKVLAIDAPTGAVITSSGVTLR